MHEVQEPELARADAPFSVRASDRQIALQQAAIAQIGQRALEQESVDKLLSETSALVSRVLGMPFVSVLEITPDKKGLQVIAGIGWRPGVVGKLTLGSSSDSLAGYTIASGHPVIAPDLGTESRFKVHESLVQHGAVSGMSVTIGDGHAPYGVLAVFTAEPARFSRDEVHFLEAVANVLAAAVQRRSIESELRTSRDQLAAIVGTIDEGITVRGREGIVFANDAAARLSGFTNAAEMIAAPADLISRFELFDEQGEPMAADRLPGRRAMAGESEAEAVVGFRIKASGEMRWSIMRGRAIRDSKGEVIYVINTFREITDERWARESREFLTNAVAVLSGTLDVHEASRTLANLSVPWLADYCTVHLLEPDGSIVLSALAHADPSRVEIARRLADRYPIDPAAPTGAARVIREGTPDVGEVTEEVINALKAPKEDVDILRQMAIRSYVTVPLMARSGAVGALTLVTTRESGRSLGQRELGLALELGARAGVALENAQLYQTADDRRAQLDAVLGALDEAMLVFDSTGGLRLMNNAAQRLFRDDRVESLDGLRDRLGLAPDQTDDTVEIQMPEGNWLEFRRYEAARAGATHGESFAPTVVMLRDVTAARSARAARDAFLGVLSHELRTPITTIFGGSELLEREMDDARRQDIIADIHAESVRLTRLVEDLLVMTRVEQGAVETGDEPILIQRVLPAIVHSFSARRRGSPIKVGLADHLPAVRGDPTYVEQVLRNLLTNAMRYGDGMDKGVEVTGTEQAGQVVIRVLDRGPGFGGDDPGRLFDLFYRSPAAKSVPGGAGIGLYVCRHLVESMGGQMWAKEREDGGAEFGFSLPIMEVDLAG